jgi:hypothetical protein
MIMPAMQDPVVNADLFTFVIIPILIFCARVIDV